MRGEDDIDTEIRSNIEGLSNTGDQECIIYKLFSIWYYQGYYCRITKMQLELDCYLLFRN